VRTAQLTGRGLVKLPVQYRSLSSDGEAWICGEGDSTTVFFYAFRGILDDFGGFIHVDPDVPPVEPCFGANHIHVEKKAPNWYFIYPD
jgi:hypothetical protein